MLADKSRPDDYDRDFPQAAMVSHCRERGIEVLDLLPLLRAHLRTGGDRPYHLRDTHWNAVGNRVAGEALGRRLAAWGAGDRK